MNLKIRMVFRYINASAFACACAFFWNGVLHAHGEHESQILELDQRLQQLDLSSPDVLPALLHRAELHRREQSWEAALNDYERVATIEPDNPGMFLGITQLYLDQHDFLTASKWSAQMLERQSNHIQALLMHARAQTGLGNMQFSTDLFSRAIDLMENPKPEHYLEHANAVLQSQRNGAAADAIAIVDTGAQKLNHPVSLHSFALKQELQSEQLASALVRINHVVARYPRLWPWHLEKAELLISLRRTDEACLAVKTLENDLQQLPPQRSNTQAIQSIRLSIDELPLVCASE